MSTRKPADYNEIEENNYIAFPYLFPSLFSKQECGEIIEHSKHLKIEQAKIGSSSLEALNTSTRISKIRWMGMTGDTQWIYQRVELAYKRANSFFNFDVLGCSYLQVTEYPVSGKYDWHEDLGENLISKRKLSISIQLCDPQDYDGGDLEFVNPLPYKSEFRQQGAAIIFPSFLSHRVTAVTRGTRWSLIAWVFGPPFR